MTEKEKIQIELAKQGSQLGFNFLVDEYWSYLFNYIFKQTQNTYLSEEICIESFAKAFDKINQFNPKYEFKTWLVQIAKNGLIDEFRKKNIPTQELNTNSLKIAEEATTEPFSDKSNKEEIVISELQKLQKDYQIVLRKYYLESMSFKEISEELKIPVNNLKVKAYRAKQKLLQNTVRKLD
jgi:RNA polymerase sigma-70 factor (ECF subfamily)